MLAYDNPAFVEDIARSAAAKLITNNRVAWFQIHVVNFESIHNHNAFARVEWPGLWPISSRPAAE
jgi:GTP cyclohydrolase I